MSIRLVGIAARGPAEPGRTRTLLEEVDLEAGEGVLAVLGTPADGTSLLADVIEGTARARSGTRTVLGERGDVHARLARVSLEAPLPEALRVDEVCRLSAELRGEPAFAPAERLALLDAAALAGRPVRGLAVEERRTVALALALGSPRVEVLIVEEPLAMLLPGATAKVAAALRGRKGTTLVTTASARDAALVATRFGHLAAGRYRELPDARALTSALRIVVRERAAELLAALGDEVRHVESTLLDRGASSIVVSGGDDLARVVTRAIARTAAAVELVEPIAPALERLRLPTGEAAR